MTKGKLLSFEKLLKNGVHDSYTGQYGTLYKFTVKFDANGVMIVGTANSKNETPKWKIGDEYTFENVVTNGFSNIKNMMSVDAQSFGGPGSKSNPMFLLQKCFEAAVEVSLGFFELNPDIYTEENEGNLIGAFYDFILKGDESKRWMNVSALRLTLLKMRANGMFDRDQHKTLTGWFISTAKTISDTMEKTCNDTLANESPVTTSDVPH